MKLLIYLLILFIITFPFYYYMNWKIEKQRKETVEVYLPIFEKQLDQAFSRNNRPSRYIFDNVNPERLQDNTTDYSF